ncbi:MAG TPA: hypothetical protein VGH46_06960, partial [Gaiellaceae bacterium]
HARRSPHGFLAAGSAARHRSRKRQPRCGADRARGRPVPRRNERAERADGGDTVPTSVGFVSPLPVVPAGHYTATLTFTVIGK